MMDLHTNTGTGSDTPPPRQEGMTREDMDSLDFIAWLQNDAPTMDAIAEYIDRQRDTIRRLEQQAEMLKGCLEENRKHADQLQARLTASEAAHKWTTERPTVEGVYFACSLLPGQEPKCVRVVRETETGGLIWLDFDSYWDWVDRPDAAVRWQGPLTPGEE